MVRDDTLSKILKGEKVTLKDLKDILENQNGSIKKTELVGSNSVIKTERKPNKHKA